MGGAIPKQFLALGGQPLMVHTLRVLQASIAVHEIILAVPAAEREYCLTHIITPHHFSKVTKIVAGGEHRQDSVRHALANVDPEVDLVLIHDAVRPFLTEQMVQQVLEQAALHGAAIIALPMRDTVKQVGTDRVIQCTVDRAPLWLAQTPQAFRRDWLEQAHQKALREEIQATDDAHLVELLGRSVVVVEGSGENIKVTRPEDIVIGEAILAARMSVKREA